MTRYSLELGVLFVVALSLSACDSLFSLDEVTLRDAAGPVDAVDAIDAPPDGPEEWGFSAAQAVTELNSTSSEGDPTLTSDLLEIYFKSTRSGGMGMDDIWYSTRASTTAPWSPPMLSKLSTPQHDNQPRLAPDGKTIWFRSGSPAKLYVAMRLAPKDDAGWSAPKELTEFQATSPTPEDAALMSTVNPPVVGYLISKRVGGQLRIFRTVRLNDTVSWGAPAQVVELEGDGTYEQSPWVTPDQRTIVFASNRSGCKGSGIGNIWLAQRSSEGEAFGPPICLSEVSTTGVDADPWISPDLRTIYFASVSGTFHIFEAHR